MKALMLLGAMLQAAGQGPPDPFCSDLRIIVASAREDSDFQRVRSLRPQPQLTFDGGCSLRGASYSCRRSPAPSYLTADHLAQRIAICIPDLRRRGAWRFEGDGVEAWVAESRNGDGSRSVALEVRRRR